MRLAPELVFLGRLLCSLADVFVGSWKFSGESCPEFRMMFGEFAQQGSPGIFLLALQWRLQVRAPPECSILMDRHQVGVGFTAQAPGFNEQQELRVLVVADFVRGFALQLGISLPTECSEFLKRWTGAGALGAVPREFSGLPDSSAAEHSAHPRFGDLAA